MVGRSAFWVSVAACSALACDGTSRWILQAASPEAGVLDADGGGAVAAGDAGGDAGSIAGGSAARDPAAFTGVCDPQIAVDNRTAGGRGALFDQAFPAPADELRRIATQVCALLYMTPDEVPVSPPIVLVIEDFYGIGEIGITAPVIYIRLSSLRMQTVAEAGRSVRDDVTGSLLFLLAIDYALDAENPAAVGWVTEGIAAWVRYRAGFTSIAERRPGGNPSADYETTGFFFDWLDRTYPDAVYRLNQSLDPTDQVAWSEAVFEQITGKTLTTLWDEYQASL